MEYSVEAVNDQDSGWFEVRKKHKSGAKLSVLNGGGTGGHSRKYGSAYQQPSLSEKNGNLQRSSRSRLQERVGKVAVNGCGSYTDSTSISSMDKNGRGCSQKSDTKQGSEESGCCSPSQLSTTVSATRVDNTQQIKPKDNFVLVPKIKWGDLDDEDLLPHPENASQSDTRNSNAHDRNLVGAFENRSNLVSLESSCSDLRETKSAVTSVDVNLCSEQRSQIGKKDVIQESHECVSELFSMHEQNALIQDKLVDSELSSCKDINREQVKQMDDEINHPSGGETNTIMQLQLPVSELNDSKALEVPAAGGNSVEAPESNETILCEKLPHTSAEARIGDNLQLHVVPEVNNSTVSMLPVANPSLSKVVISTDAESLPAGESNEEFSRGDKTTEFQSLRISVVNESQKSESNDTKGNCSKVVLPQDINSFTSQNCEPGILREAARVEVVEGSGSPSEVMRSSFENTGAPGEGVICESTERFRERLWCFLFENLNRAVDELYLLCELECDVEQMKEAILVLEEAASDFKELTHRVQDFEHVKRSSPKFVDGSPVSLKADHRRPHALSWEVRRMTTSSQRAEILSSSLEAFKKIQQERANKLAVDKSPILDFGCSSHKVAPDEITKKSAENIVGNIDNSDSLTKSGKNSEFTDNQLELNSDKKNLVVGKSNKVNFVQEEYDNGHNLAFGLSSSKLPPRDNAAASSLGKSKREYEEKLLQKKDKSLTENTSKSYLRSTDHLKKLVSLSEKDKEKKISTSWKSMNAWKEKRNWEDILSSPFRISSRVSYCPGLSRKSADRARTLHDKLMSPEKKKKTAVDLKKEAEEKHARAMRIRTELETERVQRLQRTSEKLSRVSEWQAVKNMKLREGMYARHQRSESRHEAFIAQVVKRAGDESSKVSEVRFITSLNEENKKLMLRQKLQNSELRRAEKLQIIKSKQKEDMAREEAVLERRKLIEAEKLQRLAETQRKKEEAQARREDERKASSAAREARAIDQLRRREERAKAQQEEAELLAQKLAERLSESEQRRKFYLEQIRERASMDFRDQSSPLLRRSTIKEGQGRLTPTKVAEDCQDIGVGGRGASALSAGNVTLQHSLKRRIKKIRQRLMALKYEFLDPLVGSEGTSIGYRTAVGTARAKIGRWIQELQKLRQARREGAASIGLISAEIIKFMEGRDAELQAARQARLLDFIASALPASHTSKPEDSRVTIHLLKLLRVVLSVPSNRSYFLAENLLPPIVPMLSSSLENYIKIVASVNAPGASSSPASKISAEDLGTISEVLDNFLWIVGAIMGHTSSDERELQMQDGLLELLVAYQVIHRLRDLFALYDRPQVERSPFPSSILLSIHLLVVLTSRLTTSNSIDWEFSLSDAVQGFGNHETKPAEISESTSRLLVQNDGTIVPASDISDEKVLGECSNMTRNDGSLSNPLDSEKRASNNSIILDNSNPNGADVSVEKLKIVLEEEENLGHASAKEKNRSKLGVKQPVTYLLSAISETGLVCLPSLLTAVLLQANNRISSELGPYVLPSDFEEVATEILKFLNNLALLDITFMQGMLARPDLKMEFFHLMSFLLSHCSGKWKAAGDQVGLLLVESLMLLGHFSLFHTENQAVLRWGKSPTILHKLCDLPFVFFSDSELMPVLAGTLVAACYSCEQNKGIVLQELSMDMLLSLLRSCKNVLPAKSTVDVVANESSEGNYYSSELRKPLWDTSLRPNRNIGKTTRLSLGKVGALSNSIRAGKLRSQRDSKLKGSEELVQKYKPLVSQPSIMLHCRFPSKFIDKAEHFFSAGITNICDEV